MEFVHNTIRFLCRHYPFYSGCGKIANSKWLEPFISKENRMLSTLRSGESLWIDPREHIGRSIDFFGDLDPKITWLFQQILRPGDVCVDIGANYGLLSILAANIVGDKGHVYAVEPQKQLNQMIAASAQKNHFENVTVFPVGLSDHNGNVDIYIPDDNHGAASIEHTPKGTYRTETIQILDISQFLENISRSIRLIKIDVENHEEHIIRGAKDYLSKKPADAIIIEVHPSNDLWINNPTLKILHDLGYVIYALPKSMLKVDLVCLDATAPANLNANDYLAIYSNVNGSLALPKPG